MHSDDRPDGSVEDYWDSYWIVRGLLKSELFGTANETLQNFMDELEHFGFIPNGGRIYCESILRQVCSKVNKPFLDLNRSQPPLFIQVNISGWMLNFT